MCGEKIFLKVLLSMVIGSPPRVRGKVIKVFYDLYFARITPACAGKSECSNNPLFNDEDHPRVCGEKPSELKKDFLAKDHPRVCGEKS